MKHFSTTYEKNGIINEQRCQVASETAKISRLPYLLIVHAENYQQNVEFSLNDMSFDLDKSVLEEIVTPSRYILFGGI